MADNVIIEGTVIKGSGIGSVHTVPTVNIAPTNDVALPFGVYTAIVYTESGKYNALLHYGSRPTFDKEMPSIELYLLDYEGDLYGQQIRVEVLEKVREIDRYETPEQLKKQIEQDIAVARRQFKQHVKNT